MLSLNLGKRFEKMGKVDTITFDKTGTLTFGSLEVNDILSFSDKYDNHTLLSLIASAETRSEHPLGKAIVAYAKDQNITLIETTNFQMEAGKGIYAEINNKKIFCGNEKYLKEKENFYIETYKRGFR